MNKVTKITKAFLAGSLFLSLTAGVWLVWQSDSPVYANSGPVGDWVLRVKRLIPAKHHSTKVCIGHKLTYSVEISNNSPVYSDYWYFMGQNLPSGESKVWSSYGYYKSSICGENTCIDWSSDNGLYPMAPWSKAYITASIKPDKIGVFNVYFESYPEYWDSELTNNFYEDTIEVVECK